VWEGIFDASGTAMDSGRHGATSAREPCPDENGSCRTDWRLAVQSEEHGDRRENEALALLNGSSWLVACRAIDVEILHSRPGIRPSVQDDTLRESTKAGGKEPATAKAGQHLKPHVRPDTHRRAGTLRQSSGQAVSYN
jgi:hypothetical protein